MKQFKRKLAALLAVVLVLGGILPNVQLSLTAEAAGEKKTVNFAFTETLEVGKTYMDGMISVGTEMAFTAGNANLIDVNGADAGSATGYVTNSTNPNTSDGTGAMIHFTPAYSGTIRVAVQLGANKTFMIDEVGGANVFTHANGADKLNLKFEEVPVEAGKTYYIYGKGTKSRFYSIDYVYEEEAKTVLVEKTNDFAFSEALVVGKTYMDGMVSVGTEMAFTSGNANLVDVSGGDAGSAAGYVTNSTNPNTSDGTGAMIHFTPAYSGTIRVAVQLGANKTFVIDEAGGANVFTHANGADKLNLKFEEVKVEAGKTYYIYGKGTKSRFYSITYKYWVEEEEKEDEEVVLPPIDLVDGVLAFPTAEGGGRFATGGRGGDVYVVTSLEDYAKGATPIEGTLRYAMDTAPVEGRIVVFNVGGIIMLQQEMKIANNVTLMGQTAPGEGITLAGYSTGISDRKNMIIRFMHFRPGAVNVHNGSDGMDALWGRDMDTFIIDHCSFSWNTDECLSTYRGQNGTVQWSIISESLTLSGHSKGRHGYGGIFGGDNCTFQYNLIADHTSRNPRIGGGYMGEPTVNNIATLQVSNNVLYNWGFNNCYGGGYAYTNYINNYHRPGIGTNDSVSDQLINPGSSGEPSGFYIAGNYVEGTDNPFIKDAGYDKPETAYVKESFDDVTIIDAKDCYELVLNAAGSTYPKRDAIDARVIQSVIDDTGFFVNTEDEVGGYSAPTETRAADYDTDMDGIPDEWETAHGLDPKNSLDSRELAESGYAWVEVYCNELVGEQCEATYVAPNPVVYMDLKNNTLVDEGKDVVVNVEATAKNGGKIAKVEFYNGVTLVGTDTEAPFSYTYKGLADDTYNISVRAYDNDGNATQSTPAKLHVNSTKGTGDWTLATIGKADVEGRASLVDGVLTVKGNGKLGIRDGADSEYDKVNGTDYASATTDECAYVYQKFTGDIEIVTRLDSYIATNIHTYNGIMFRESLDDNAASVGLGFTMSKQVESTTIWNAFMAQRKTTDGAMTNLGGALDDADSAANAGIPFVYALNFKNGAEFTGMWLKLAREGDNFTGYVSEDGLTWRKVGTLTVDLPEEVYVGFAVESGEGANEIDNYATAKFSNIKINTEFATIKYDVEKLNCDGAEKIAVGEDVVITLSAGAGYLLPETVEVTRNGIPVNFVYDAEKGTILIEKAEGEYLVKAIGVKRQVFKANYEEVDPDNLMTVEEKDGVIILTQTSVNGALANNPDTPAIEQSYLLFPETTAFQTMSLKVKVTDKAATANPKQTGLFVGAFNIAGNTFTSLSFRHDDGKDTAEEFAPFWTKDATRTGNGSPKAGWELGVEYDITFKSNGKGGLQATINASDGSMGAGAGLSKNWNATDMYMKEGDPVRFGLALIGVTVEVKDIVLIDHEGIEIYPGEGLPEAEDTVEDAIDKAIAANPENAQAAMEQIFANYDSDMLVAEMKASQALSAKVAALVSKIADDAIANSANDEEAMNTILASVGETVLAEAMSVDTALAEKIAALTAEDEDEDDEDEDEEEASDGSAADGSGSASGNAGSATSPKTFFEEGSFINSILWPETDNSREAQKEQSAVVESEAVDVEAEDADAAASALIQTAEKNGGNMFAIIVVAALAGIAASGAILFRKKNDEM